MTSIDRLEKQLKDISEILKNTYNDDSEIGVFSGISGISLFQFYYSKYLGVDYYSDCGVEMITESINRINKGYNYPTYCGGIAGAGWVVEHLSEEGFVEIDTDGLLSDLDAYLYDIMVIDITNNNYDFLHGAIGYGYYFLKRFQNTKSEKLKVRYTEFLIKLLKHLQQLSIKNEKGIKWVSVIDKTTGVQGYNLSLSHGISSIINFLSRLHKYLEFRQSVVPLLKGAISFVLNYENEEEGALSLFPSWVSDPYEKNSSRLSWCYGDLGLGVSLRIAAIALKDDDLYNKSLVILKHSAHRRTKEQSFVKDSAICHGAFGNALIFSRLYKETQDSLFQETASYWMKEGIAMATFEDGYVGYKQWGGDEIGWKNEIGFLTGIAGIGMTILFYLSDFETSWDECLMIS